MGLAFQPKEGTVLMCDFRGYEVPEIIKKRPVAVIRKHRTNGKLVSVVPLSNTAPNVLLEYHVEIRSILKDGGEACWAKSDLLATVSLNRLDRCKVLDRHGNRQYVTFHLSKEELEALKKAVRSALGL
jgi:uncharacterized protein YifN (PemK superfamily)